MSRENDHDPKTFRHVLSDYFSYHGIEIPGAMKGLVLKVFYDSGGNLEPVCALQYGNSILFVQKPHTKPVEALFLLDLQKKSFQRVPVTNGKSNGR